MELFGFRNHKNQFTYLAKQDFSPAIFSFIGGIARFLAITGKFLPMISAKLSDSKELPLKNSVKNLERCAAKNGPV